jgi:hypothetical protein
MNGVGQVPFGVAYVLGRWQELTDPRAPWWAQCAGLGTQLRIKELLELSSAHREGVIYASAIERIRKQANSTLAETKTFLDERFGPLRELLKEALSGGSKRDDSGLGMLWPGSGAHASLRAGLKFLEGLDYMQAVAEELERRAKAAESIGAVRACDELIELLDAELISYGHSRRWREEFYAAVATAIQNGEELAAAIVMALQNRGERREFEVIVAVEELTEAENPEVPLPHATGEELRQMIGGWANEPEADELDFPEGGLQIRVHASDPFAATEAAAELFGQWQAIWSLQGGSVRLRNRYIAYDGMTPEPIAGEELMEVRPKNLDELKLFPGEREGQRSSPQRLTDGLLQLAQARRSPVGAALSDLWGVAEVCFSGVAVGSRDQAGPVIAGIAQYLYLTDQLEWLGTRFEALGVEPAREASQSMAEWTLSTIVEHSATLFPKLKAEDAVAWTRASQVARWDENQYLHADLLEVRERVEAACARAYLIRNFYIHSGRADRSAAIAVALPVFAELLRISLGFAMQSKTEPVVSARLAMLRVRQLGFDYKERDVSGPSALAEAINPNLIGG